MTEIDASEISWQDQYKLMVGTVTPRPIALVTTIGPDGPNAAPFSFFNVIGDDPPAVVLAPGNRGPGVPKDTARNVRLTGDGERLLVHARKMIAAADAMLARFRAGDLKGEVRFGSPEDFASAYLPDILGVFAAAHENVQLHVSCKLTLPLIGPVMRLLRRRGATP